MKIITAPKLKLELNKTEAKGIRKVYKEMLNILKSPDDWMQGEFKYEKYYNDTDTAVDGYRYCVIGAAQEVDGRYEDLAKVFMLLNPPSGWDFATPAEDDRYEDDGYELDSLQDLSEFGEDEAISFNDNSGTRHKDVVKWLRVLVKKTDKIIGTPAKVSSKVPKKG